MPAVQIIQLRSEIAALNQTINQPGLFALRLVDFLESYSNRVYRPGQSVAGKGKIDRFHVHPFILNQMEIEFTKISQEDRITMLALVDQLIDKPFFEVKYLACYLLGQISPTPPGDILDRLNSWLDPSMDFELQEMMITHTTLKLRRMHPRLWQETIEGWLQNPDVLTKRMGLTALKSLVNDQEVDYLPFIFRMLQEPLLRADQIFRPILLELVKGLLHRSPIETSFFFKQFISMNSLSSKSAQLIRKMLPNFPQESQIALREMLKSVPEIDNEEVA